jgi:hypothetical protein
MKCSRSAASQDIATAPSRPIRDMVLYLAADCITNALVKISSRVTELAASLSVSVTLGRHVFRIRQWVFLFQQHKLPFLKYCCLHTEDAATAEIHLC